MHPKIEAKLLTKKWSSGFELGPLNFNAFAGETIAVFGKNGSGKSTFFQLLTGAIDRTAGELKICDGLMSPDAVEIRQHVGYLPQESTLPEWSTPLEILTYTANVRGLSNPQDLVHQQLNIWDALAWQNKPLCKTSHGMQRRIGLAVALLHDPELLILDEPFNALDIVNSRTLETIIKQRADSGKTTLISMHSPLLAAAICPRAILFVNGKLEDLTQWTNLGLTERAEIINSRFFCGSAL